MNLILKTTLKNVIGKPFRSFLVIFSIFICSIAGMFCFDLMKTEQVVVDNLFRQFIGDADVSFAGQGADLSLLPEGFPEHNVVGVMQFGDTLYENVPGEFFIVSAKQVRVVGIDIDSAVALGMLDEGMPLNDMEAIVTKSFADLYGCEVGDTVQIHDVRGEYVDLTVAYIVPTKPLSILYRGNSAVVNENTAEVLSCGQDVNPMYFFDFADDESANLAESMLNETFPNADVSNFATMFDNEEELKETMGMMFLVFAIAFLLVIFITASICERIVSERMSFVGTLRSLGLSARNTGFILLLENVVYAILGSVPAVILYSLVRDSMYESILSFDMSDGSKFVLNVDPLSPLLCTGVIIGAIVVECIIPLKAQIKALNTSIRDIIFDNRDTDYKFSRFGITVGTILLITCIVSFFFRNNIYGAAVCMISGVFALSFLFPLLLRVITNFIKDTASKADKERWALAAVEAGSRKSAVGSGVLSVTSTAMCIIVFTVAMSIMGNFSGSIYDCDVVAFTSKKPDYYTYVEHLDGVTDTEIIYSSGTEYVQFNGEDHSFEFYGLPDGGFRMYNAYTGVPERIEDGTIMLNLSWASRHDISEGDVVTITINPNGVFPIEKQYTVAGFFKTVQDSGGTEAILMSYDDYSYVFHPTPGMLLIRTDNPDATADALRTYGVGTFGDVKTNEEVMNEQKDSNATTLRIFGIIIGIALGMTCIGMVSNQLIGFEGRKKECAVMLSTAMNKKTLSDILFREMIITSVTSSAVGTIVGSILLLVIRSAMNQSDNLYMPISYKPGMVLLFWVIITLVFALTVLFPIKNLKKMKIAEQIKYE